MIVKMKHERKLAKLRKCVKQLEMEKDNSHWDDTLVALLEGVGEIDEKIMRSVLQQQWDYLRLCKNNAQEVYENEVAQISLPVVRRIFDDFPIRNLVGVQPISKLVDTVYSLEYRYEDVETDELITYEEFASLPKSKNPFHLSHKLTMQIVENDVEAGSRKLNAIYTPIKESDLVHAFGLNIQCEKTQALAQEMRQDITDEVLCDLKALGGEPEEVSLESDTAEQINTLVCRIRANTSAIAQATRRGHGNWIVVSKAMANLLSKDKTINIEIKDDYKSKRSEMLEVGTLSDVVRIFVANVPDDEILIGYKGPDSETDTGYFYCPHTALMSGGYSICPASFKEMMVFHSRYGKFTTENVKAYYRNIKVVGDVLVKKE